MDQLNSISETKGKGQAYAAPTKQLLAGLPNQAGIGQKGQNPLYLKVQSSRALTDRNRKNQIDNRAADMVWKVVEYDNMRDGDKLDYLKVTIQKCEAALRQRTDRAL